MNFSYLIIVLLIVAFGLQVDFIFYIIYVCVGVYVWSRWRTPRTLKAISVQRTMTHNAFWGETLPVQIELTNNSRFGVAWIQVNETVALQLNVGDPLAEVLALGAGETAVLHYNLTAKRRGYYQVGPLRLSTSDLFGFMPTQSKTIPIQYFTVYPRIIPLTQLGLPSRLPFGTVASKQRLFEDPARPTGVRDYRSGDSLRQINWKASARASLYSPQLMVRTNQPAISLETAVCLDLNRSAYAPRNQTYYIEWGIEIASSICAHLVNKRQAVGFLTNGADPLTGLNEGKKLFDSDTGRLMPQYRQQPHADPQAFMPPPIPPRNGRAHLMKILERLARLDAIETIPLSDWLVRVPLHLSWGVTVIIITPAGTEIICQSLHRLVQGGYNPILITTEPDGNFNLVRQRARGLGFMAYNLTQMHDLDQWRVER